MDKINLPCASNTLRIALNVVCAILRSIFLHNPLTELLPLVVPDSNLLPLLTRAVLATVNVSNPVIMRLVFEVRPPETVLCKCALLSMLVDCT